MRKQIKRVQLDMSEEAFQFLDSLKEKTNSASRAEVIKNAIFYYNYLVEEILKENQIVVRDNTGKEANLVVPVIPKR
jgi:metal-responsive CopG/Arc/MetJ family transcriptional regulator